MTITLIDGVKQEVNTRREIERLWRLDKISLVEAANALIILLHLHPSHAPKIWGYLEAI
jgi:hypothetical protein